MNKITSFTEKQKEILRSIKSLKHTYILCSSSILYTDSIYILTSNTWICGHTGHLQPLSASTRALAGSAPCRAATPQCDILVCSACFCCHQLVWKKAGFGISIRKCWALSANREWDCEFQWTSKKVNLRLDAPLKAAAAALGQLQFQNLSILQ